MGLANTVYALDASTIDLYMSLFPWAKFRKTKSAVKLHTLPDLRGNIPILIIITYGKVHDVNILDELAVEPGAICIMDLDFGRLYAMRRSRAFFVVRAKKKFYGNWANAVKTQIRIAISAYALVANIKKRLEIEIGLYTILQILNVSLFEKTPLITGLFRRRIRKRRGALPQSVDAIRLTLRHLVGIDKNLPRRRGERGDAFLLTTGCGQGPRWIVKHKDLDCGVAPLVPRYAPVKGVIFQVTVSH